MPTFILEERKLGKPWQKVPELGRVQTISQQEAERRFRDQINIIDSIDVALCLESNKWTFNPTRKHRSRWRIRKVSEKKSNKS